MVHVPPGEPRNRDTMTLSADDANADPKYSVKNFSSDSNCTVSPNGLLKYPATRELATARLYQRSCRPLLLGARTWRPNSHSINMLMAKCGSVMWLNADVISVWKRRPCATALYEHAKFRHIHWFSAGKRGDTRHIPSTSVFAAMIPASALTLSSSS